MLKIKSKNLKEVFYMEIHPSWHPHKPDSDAVPFSEEDLRQLQNHVDSRLEILRAISALSEQIEEKQKQSDKTEKRRFFIATAIAALSFFAGAIAATAAILALIPS